MPQEQPQRGDEHRLYREFSQLNNELLTAQRDLAKANAALSKANAEKNHLLGMAAHDIRGPLGVIQLYSDFLLTEATNQLTQEQTEFLAIIQSSSKFILQLVNDLLDLTKIEAGRLELECQPTDLIALVHHNIALNQILATQKQIVLSHTLPDQLPLVLLDPAKIEQVLNNLLSNAIKFSNPQSTVHIALHQAEETVTLQITDQGQGIPASELDRLFVPFQKTSVRSTAGEPSTGLGLAIVRRIVQGHKGTIQVESEVGKGTTFWTTLPAPPAAQEASS